MTARERRIILVPPATPGSKGDEGMVRGALELFRSSVVVILNASPECLWIEKLGLASDERQRVSDAAGPIRDFAQYLEANDLVFFLGADVIDGTCGLEPSLERIELMASALARGAPVYVSCSFRSVVASEILEPLRLMSDAIFLLRDNHSLGNFERQTGLAGRYLPDISFFCPSSSGAPIETIIADIAKARKSYEPVIGVNFAEHSFRSFFEVHSDLNRKVFVGSVLRELSASHPNAFYVLLSNDERRWHNHPSDDDYQQLAQEWLIENIGEDRALTVCPSIAYGGNITVLSAVDFLVTGRMHLSLAAFRAGTLPLVMMAQGKGYSSVDKMRGAFEKHAGSAAGVISKVGQLGAASAQFFANRQALKDRVLVIDAELRTARAQDAKALLEEMHSRALPGFGQGGQLGMAPMSALAGLIRRSDQLIKDQAVIQTLRHQFAGVQSRELNAARLGDESKHFLANNDSTVTPAQQRIANMAVRGDRLAEELRRAYANPWRPLRFALRRFVLRSLLLLEGVILSKRRSEMLRRSIARYKLEHVRHDWLVARGFDAGNGDKHEVLPK